MRNLLRKPFLAWRSAAPFLGASRARLIGLTVASLIRAVIEAVVLVLVAQIALALSEGESSLTADLGPLSSFEFTTGQGVIVCLVGGMVILGLSWLLSWITARMASDATSTARRRLLAAFSRASWNLQATERTGHLQELLTSYVLRVANALTVVATSITASLSLLALLVTALLANAPAAAAMVFAILVVAAMMRPLTRKTREFARREIESNSALAAEVTESVSIAQEVRVFGVTGAMADRLSETIERSRRNQFDMYFLRRAVPSTYQSAGVILIAAALGAVVLIDPEEISGLAVVVLLFVRAVSYGQQLSTAGQQASAVVPPLQELQRQEKRYRAAQVQTTGERIDHIGPLEFRDVQYSYGDGPPAIDGQSWRIDDGEMIGIVGPSGSGKSTLVQLLLRLREPGGGEFLVNGRPASDFDLESWYERVAVVPQRPQLLDATVAENIAFFRSTGEEEIRRAAREAQIHEEILAMPDGYETVLAGSGGSVSGGQAQRLCIARALVGRPDLVVLDEPTSALDVRSESAVQRALESMHGTTTMVIIAHRLSTLRVCDQIMVLEEGIVEDFGPAARLLENEGFYREAYELSQL